MKIVIKKNTKPLGEVKTGEFIVDENEILWLVLGDEIDVEDEKYLGRSVIKIGTDQIELWPDATKVTLVDVEITVGALL